MGSKLKVLTLNCWGVFTPLACDKRHERMDAIGKELSKGEYDIVLLQEIWTQADYNKLCDMIIPALPYTHYWHSGMFGTGVCIFSKHCILETSLWRFHCNGQAHKIHHGDWYGGKGVGLATVLFNDVKINVYSTHLIAQYNEQQDEYVAHRVAQAFEMSQFIKLTSDTCDIVLTGGDFNIQPYELGYKIIRYHGNMKDAWIHQSAEHEEHAATADSPINSFIPAYRKASYPHGKRLDYLLYRQNAGYDISCEKCYLTLEQIPGETYHYSDHEGVAAIFDIKKNVTAMSMPRDSGEIEKHLTDALPVLDNGMKKVKVNRIFYSICTIMCLLALAMTSGVDMPYGVGWTLSLVRFILCGGVVFYIWMGLVMADREMNGLWACRKDVNFALKSNPSVTSKR